MFDPGYGIKIELVRLMKRKDNTMEMMVTLRRKVDHGRDRLSGPDVNDLAKEVIRQQIFEENMRIDRLAKEYFRLDVEIRKVVSQLTLPDYREMYEPLIESKLRNEQVGEQARVVDPSRRANPGVCEQVGDLS